MRKAVCLAAAGAALLAAVAAPASADPPTTPLSGAIFTTNASGVPVNLNIYQAKEDVYLNGGPGINAPDDAAGLPAGTYSFQVTDPSGKTLLSSDDVACRQVTVDDSGVFQSVVPSGGCEHSTSTDGEHEWNANGLGLTRVARCWAGVDLRIRRRVGFGVGSARSSR